jgi:hypothetical protein
MNARIVSVGLLVVGLMSACGGGSGKGGGGGAGGSSGCGTSVAGTAATNPEGILTNYPSLHITKVQGDFTITTVYFTVETGTSFSTVRVWGDLKNNGPSQLCIPLYESFDIGTQDVLVVVDGNPYQSTFSSVTDVCVEPGGTAAFTGIQNNVSASLLTNATSVSYEFSGLVTSPGEIPEPNDPTVLSIETRQVTGGWAVGGQMRSGPMTIYNLDVQVYIRDPNGLLYDDQDAFPGDLNDIPPNTMFDFETYPTMAKFCDYLRFDSFIEGSMTAAALGDPGNPREARRGEAQRRRAALRTARGLLSSSRPR